MVTEYGMSERLGPVNLGGQEEIFVGRNYGQVRDHSEETSQLIDSEVRSLLDEAYRIATQILVSNREVLNRIAERLLEKETLNHQEFQNLIEGVPPFNILDPHQV